MENENAKIAFAASGERSSIWSRDPDIDLSESRAYSFPRKLLLSLCSRCSLRCGHCVRGHFPCEPGAVMSKQTLNDVVSDFFPRVSTVWLGGSDLGEQMLSPYFDDLLKYAQEREGPDLEMVTSGVMITSQRASLMARSMSHVYLSLEGVGSHYTRIRGIPWDDFLQRLKWLTVCRDAATTRRRLDVSFHVTVMRQLQRDCHQLVDLAKQWRIRSIDFRHFVPLLPSHTLSSLLYYPSESNRFFRDLADHGAAAGVAITTPSECPVDTSADALRRHPCYLPFETIGIDADGRVRSCCNARFTLGCYEPGLGRIERLWNGPQYLRLRASVNSAHPLPACVRCDAVNDDPRVYRPEFGMVDRVRLGLKRVLPLAVARIVRRS